MRPVFEAMAVLALVGVVVLLFAWSALLATVRELQAARRAETGTRQGPSRAVPGLTDPDGRLTVALVVESDCASCHERLADFEPLAAQLRGHGVRPVVVASDHRAAAASPDLPVVLDPGVWTDLAVAATPLLAAVEPDGQLRWQRLVGSREELLGQLNSLTSSTGGRR